MNKEYYKCIQRAPVLCVCARACECARARVRAVRDNKRENKGKIKGK